MRAFRNRFFVVSGYAFIQLALWCVAQEPSTPATITPGDYFIFSKDIGGGEWFQFYRFDSTSGDVALLTDGKSRNLGDVWSNRGDRIAYSSTRRNRADLDFYLMNPADKSTDRLLVQNQGGGWQ